MGQLVKHEQLDAALESVDDVLRWQAEQSAKLRPSQRDRWNSSSQQLNYHAMVKGQHQQVTVKFPPSSGYFGAESILALHGLYEACKEKPEYLEKAERHIDQLASVEAEDPYLQLARLLAKVSFSFWSDDWQETEEALTAAGGLQLGVHFIDLARTRLLYESGRFDEALEVVENLRPTNQRMLVDRELTILQLLLQLGDLDRAKQSSQKLFALRLKSDTEFKLADLMYQLGMGDLGDRMMGRIRRRAGGKQDTLVKLMSRYADAGDNKQAAEIARQVVRRTSPAVSRRYRTSESHQHQQAVQILARTGELQSTIEQYEKLVERSPRSTKLTNKLAAFYEAGGRREDAEKLRLKAADNAPNDPRSLMAAGRQLAALGKHEEAVEKFVAAVIKAPDTLNNDFYEMRTSFKESKSWDQLSDAIVEEGIAKFAHSYRLSELVRELTQQKSHEAVNQLLLAGLEDLQWNQLSRMFYSFSRGDFKPNEEVVELIGEKLTAEDSSFTGMQQNTYVSSRSSNGKTTAFINGVATIVAADEGLTKRVSEAMKARLAKNEKDRFPCALLCLILAETDDFEGVRQTIQPLMQKESKTNEDAYAIWCIGSMLTHDAKQPGLACEILESVEDDSLWERSGSGFQYSAIALLAYSYEQADRKADAREILLERLRTEKIDERQNQYNPGYGEYQYIESLSGLSKTFLRMGYPAEAFIAYRKAYADESMLDRANRWGGNQQNQKKRLRDEINKKTDRETILKIIAAAIAGQQTTETDEDFPADVAVFLTSPQVQRNSLIDTRVTMLLEEFTLKIAEDDALRQAVSTWLTENPLNEERHALKKLVTRLLISDAAKDDEQIAATSLAIREWVQTHEATHPSNEQQTEANDGDAAVKPEQSEPKTLPDELLLGMAALRMPQETLEDEEVVVMLERAAKIAEAEEEESLAGSLQCQIARRIAESDPDRAREIFLKALNDVLPVGNGKKRGGT